MCAFKECEGLTPEETRQWDLIQLEAKCILKEQTFGVLTKLIEDTMTMVSNLLMQVTAINFGVDKELGTSNSIFATLGPNMGNYGNGEVSIVFHPAILQHPDTFLTPVAAMGYYQGWYVSNGNLGIDRPWAGDAKTWDCGGREDYENNKFQTTTPSWDAACALEWISRVVCNNAEYTADVGERAHSKTFRTVTLDDVQKLWCNSDPHTAVEAHLPGLIPLSYIEAVYIKRPTPPSDTDDGTMSTTSMTSSMTSTRAKIINIADAEEQNAKLVKAFKDRGLKNVFVVDDPSLAVFELFTKTPFRKFYNGNEVCRGYSFCIEPGFIEHEIPLDISTSTTTSSSSLGKKRIITFTIENSNPKTQDFLVTLSSSPFGTDKRKCVTFQMPPFSLYAQAYMASPAEIGKMCAEATPALILDTTDGSYQTFTLEVVAGEGATLTCLGTNKSVEIKSRKPLNFISFSASVYRSSVWELEIR